ncbi:MAG: phosphate signaling complex protein PhoU [Chloroflexi bacterium]|nr:phosphate signaling complex protein PhoU [Ardenticatenaceae bacterium]MBL1128248.1 phosphate transport system regulatory protein PhoU [Chloroflexota bacterium]NOG34321.1 phosphate signaling complex protein PhoU [Chloroflexota bacterium]GIK57322.1 MAG: phosphate transport system regulatory protein PhoU [Chloroflexota bacterium]
MNFQKRSLLEKDIDVLNQTIQQMSHLVEEATAQAVQALLERDGEVERQIINQDAQVNGLRYQVEKLALQAIATQQPMAGDLRAIMTAVYVALELERIGDHAVNIARLVLRVDADRPFTSLYKLPAMAQRARDMVHEAVLAFLQRDEDLARLVMADDDRIDARYAELIRETLQDMRDDDYIPRATTLLLVGQNLERIGDRATNIAERAIFAASGVVEEAPSEPYP